MNIHFRKVSHALAIGQHRSVSLESVLRAIPGSLNSSFKNSTNVFQKSYRLVKRAFYTSSVLQVRHFQSRLSSNISGPDSFIRELNIAQKHCLDKFINLCMKKGKKNKSYKIISSTLSRLTISENLKARNGIKSSAPIGLILFMKAIENVKPIIEVKKVRISGTTQLVPSIIPKNRQKSLAIRWIIEAAILRRNTKKSMTLDQCLFAELVDAYQNIGAVRKKRDDLHKLADSNRGFAHYRWW